MVRAYLKFEGNEWKRVEKSDFWMDEKLLDVLNSIRMIKSKGWDAVIIIDGKERSGKSTLGMTIGWYLSDCQMTKVNFAKGLDDCAKKISELPDGSVLQIDEGSLVFSSKDYALKEQKTLMKILDVVGQKNLILIVCLPCFFDLNKTIAVRRSLFLLHTYTDGSYNRGRYAFWGEQKKKVLYKTGKTKFDSYAYPPANWIGYYMDFEPPFYKEYLEEIKKESLNEILESAIDKKKERIAVKIKELKKNVTLRLKEKYPKMTQQEISYIINTPQPTISDWLQEIRVIPV